MSIEEERRNSASLVYFIQSGDTGPIKIGRTQNLTQRMQVLQTASAEPLHLLAAVPGGVKYEKWFHEKLRPYHIRGEWFHNTIGVKAFLWEETWLYARVDLAIVPSKCPDFWTVIDVENSMVLKDFESVTDAEAFVRRNQGRQWRQLRNALAGGFIRLG